MHLAFNELNNLLKISVLGSFSMKPLITDMQNIIIRSFLKKMYCITKIEVNLELTQ